MEQIENIDNNWVKKASDLKRDFWVAKTNIDLVRYDERCDILRDQLIEKNLQIE